MMVRVVGAWGFAFIGLVAVACGGDDEPSTTCGAGTALKGSECVAAAGAGGMGGDPPCAEGDCGGSGGSVGGQLEGGTAHGGSAGQGAAAGSDVGGAGMAGGAGGAALGGAGAGGGDNRLITRWLAFEHEDGAFVYDVTQFPDPGALLQLGTGRLGTWSPDGRQLLYSQQGAWYVRDLAAETPGRAVLLVESAQLLPHLAWSADSKSIAMTQGTTLSVLAPSEAAPSLVALTATLIAYKWAPVGNKLVYADASGGHVVDVVAGVPGEPVAVDPRARQWSPNGDALAANHSDGTLTLTNLHSVPPTVTTLFAPTGPGTGMESVLFNRDGSRLATDGWKDRDEMDAFYVDLLPTPGALSTPYAELPETQGASSVGWSPNGDFLLYHRYDDETDTGQYFAVDVSGEGPGTPVPLAAHTLEAPLWLAGGLKLITDATASSVAIFDLLAPESPQPLLQGVALSACVLNPAGSVLGYRTPRALRLLDLAAPQQPPTEIELLQVAGNVGKWAWSPDGSFIAAVTLTSSDQQRLVRIDDDGLTASTPISLGTPSDDAVFFRWQP